MTKTIGSVSTAANVVPELRPWTGQGCGAPRAESCFFRISEEELRLAEDAPDFEAGGWEEF